MSVITTPGTGERLTAGPTSTHILVPGRTTGGRRGVVELHIDGGWSGPPAHVHEHVEHVWYVIDGAVTLTVDGTRDTYTRGACLWVPPGSVHAFSTADTDGAVVLQVDTPPLDAYFRALHAAFPPGTPPDPAAVGAIMAQHDTRPVMTR